MDFSGPLSNNPLSYNGGTVSQILYVKLYGGLSWAINVSHFFTDMLFSRRLVLVMEFGTSLNRSTCHLVGP